MGVVSEAVAQYKKFVESFGEPLEISAKEALKADQDTVWTLWSDEWDELVPGLREGDEVSGFFTTPRGRDSSSASAVPYYIWIECPTCFAEEEDCEDCDGGGLVGISMPECVGLTTEQEMLATRSK